MRTKTWGQGQCHTRFKAELSKRRIITYAKELSMSRLGLIKDRTATANRLQKAQRALVRRQLKARLRFIETQLAELDGAMIVD